MKKINFLKKNTKVFLLILDILFIIISYYFAYMLLYDTFTLYKSDEVFISTVFLAAVIYEACLNIFDVYSHIVKYENGKDYLIYIGISFISFSATIICSKIFLGIANIKLNMLACILISTCIIGYRIVLRSILSSYSSIKDSEKCRTKAKPKNLLIIGAGIGARDIIKTIKARMKDEYNIVGIVDDDKNKVDYSISGVRVLGGRKDILDICEKSCVDLIFFTIYKIDAKDKKEIFDICQKTGAKLRILPSTEAYIKNKNVFQNLRDVEIDDLLYRDPIRLDNSEIAKLIENNVILVTGGGGSIGSELCRQIVKYNPQRLVIFDIYENNLYDIEQELKDSYSNINIDAVVGSIRDKKRLDDLFKKYRPNLVFHAAAHKHVPLMENSPLEAIKNNVFGTYNVINCCDRYSADRFVLISSDKAVNPTNIMGATKRLCEMMVQAKDKVSKTDYVAVRFGNVLGSNGSVVPLFKKQIAHGGPVTVTDENITRFFMTIPEAAQLVLQAITYAKGGEIFVLDMGKPVKIYDLAISLIKLSGFEPNVDIPIKITGLRPGEKLYEELLMKEEGLTTTKHNKIYVSKPMNITMDALNQKLMMLSREIRNEDANLNKIKKVIKKVVPTYIGKIDDIETNRDGKNKQKTISKIYYLDSKNIKNIVEDEETLKNVKA